MREWPEAAAAVAGVVFVYQSAAEGGLVCCPRALGAPVRTEPWEDKSRRAGQNKLAAGWLPRGECLHIHARKYTHTHTHRNTDTHRNPHTDTHRNQHTDTHRNQHTDTQTHFTHTHTHTQKPPPTHTHTHTHTQGLTKTHPSKCQKM